MERRQAYDELGKSNLEFEGESAVNILVYGAGVLGSLLAHMLHSAGHKVTLLARGQRLEELKQKGLVIRHWLQCRTTRDQIHLTDAYQADDAYDIVFVVMRASQLDGVLPSLAANEGDPLIVLVGNNLDAAGTERYINEHSKDKKRVAFAFQTSGGRRENGRIISIHMGGGKLTAGSLGGDKAAVMQLSQALSGTRMKLKPCDDMDAWLKSHAAFVLPIAMVCYAVDGKLWKAVRDKALLSRAIDAMDEAYAVLEACGVPVPSEDVDFVRRQRRKCYRFLKLLAATPIGHLAASDHAMTAKDEMRRLYDDFLLIKQKAGIETPAWNELEIYMPTV